MTSHRDHHPVRLRRSVLCVPADNARALEKVADLACDAVIYDLEDAVMPGSKASARAALVQHLTLARKPGLETVVRINSLSSGEGEKDLSAMIGLSPDAILLPKVESPGDVQDAVDRMADLDASDSIRLWAMIETPRGVLNAAAIAEAGRTYGGRLDCLVPGLNDLRKETGIAALPGRTYLVSFLMQILLSARSCGLDVIDAVFNDLRDMDSFASECAEGRDMGFDGKMLIHPSQIATANQTFGADPMALTQAHLIIDAFARSENADKGVLTVSGVMVERLHLEQALRLAAKAEMIAKKE